jgi:phosphatidylethanolamine/phosphatidyl-N-methylethanolamine N-methyltransferase
MSSHAQGFDHIVELGAGTGPITAQLQADHPRASLTLFERDSKHAGQLARRFPAAAVFDGCLHDHASVLLAHPARTVAVSALPFRSLPASVRVPTIELLEAFLLEHPMRRLVQFTYGWREPFTCSVPALKWGRHRRVWANLPPAAVWTLQRA